MGLASMILCTISVTPVTEWSATPREEVVGPKERSHPWDLQILGSSLGNFQNKLKGWHASPPRVFPVVVGGMDHLAISTKDLLDQLGAILRICWDHVVHSDLDSIACGEDNRSCGERKRGEGDLLLESQVSLRLGLKLDVDHTRQVVIHEGHVREGGEDGPHHFVDKAGPLVVWDCQNMSQHWSCENDLRGGLFLLPHARFLFGSRGAPGCGSASW